MLDLVIPDTGPLITLGLIGRFDLLERFRCPVLVTDMIDAEVMRGPATAPDRLAYERWTANKGNRIQTVDTLYGSMWKALTEEKRKEIKRQFPNAGEESIREFTGKLKEILPADDQVLVLFEEEKVKRMSFGRHVHLLHTYAFLVTVQRLGLIPSADALWQQACDRGRVIARDLYDRHATGVAGADVDWQDDYDTGPPI